MRHLRVEETQWEDAKTLSGVALSHCPGALVLDVVIPEFPAWRMADGNELTLLGSRPKRTYSSTVSYNTDSAGISRLAPSGIRHLSLFWNASYVGVREKF
jgi:hypothetical protein